ncbi:hypothetical protein PP940_gp138 [Rhizobium phage RL2RES]|uniref:Uncharacterized protein n=1 Tax=Rhizobium phage RL2RES TaxID=103371 RepID=A0A6B9J677_9CAUD|nr:hypothetical protein PP940_gp138 [Rhizobium phage RL2RES]QGZ14275.1 hypothetical protein RL2RES_138 [Rhizobium phage RL2RES]
MEINESATLQLQKELEDNGFIVERVFAPMLYREDLGVGLVKSYGGTIESEFALLFNDVRDQIFLLGVYTKETETTTRVIVRYVLASEFGKRN